ncbi:MAG: TonB-dependent receptor, partial [Bacteroidia bacterium]|nr:TonB-dependent receptor [Bacteroidia bacterium]
GVQIQGLDPQYTLILIDGVPLVGRSAGTLDLSRLTVGNIKQIEIVKGASSSLYGSEALGGVINIITDLPKQQGLKGDLDYRFGTFNSHDLNLDLGYRKGKLRLNGFINYNSSDGYDLNNAVNVNTVDPYHNITINPRLQYDFSDDTNLFVSFRGFHQNQDYVPTQTEQGDIITYEWNTHLKLNHKYHEKWSSYFEFYATGYDTEQTLNDSETNQLVSKSNYDELLIRPEIRATFEPNYKTTFIGGLGMDHESLERNDFSVQPIFNSPYIFLQYDADITEKLNLILGARYDSHSDYKSQFSPKSALRYEITDELAVKGSVGYGFKAPDFRQLYFDLDGFGGYTVLGYNMVPSVLQEMFDNGLLLASYNQAQIDDFVSDFRGALRPESSIAYNVGFTYRPIHALNFEINFFRNDITDLIDSRQVAVKATQNGVFSYVNVNKAYTQGFEFNANWQANEQFKISGGYQYLIAKDKDAEAIFESGQAFASTPQGAVQLSKDDYFGLPNRSRYMANVKLFYENKDLGLNTNIRGVYRSKYGLFDTNGTVNGYIDKYDDFVEGFSIWDLAINKTVFKNYELGIGIDNVFDFTDWPESAGDQVFIANIPGRLFYGTLNIKF